MYTNVLRPARRRRTAVLHHDAVPARVVRVRKGAQDALVRVDAREQQRPVPALPQVPPQGRLLVPQAGHAVLGQVLVEAARGRRQGRVERRVALPRHQRPPHAVAQVRAEPGAARRVGGVDQRPREAARHRGWHAGYVVLGEPPVQPNDLGAVSS